MSKITGQALALVRRLMGHDQPQVPGPVEFDDAHCSQVLDVNRLASRAQALINTEGWAFATFQNVHGAADEELSTIGPYNPIPIAIRFMGGYPETVPHGFDIWLGGCCMHRSAAGGALTAGFLRMSAPGGLQAWGITDDLLGRPEDPAYLYLARFESMDESYLLNVPGLTEAGEVWVPLNMRIPRGCSLSFLTVSAGAATFRLNVTLGIFPSGAVPDIAQ